MIKLHEIGRFMAYLLGSLTYIFHIILEVQKEKCIISIFDELITPCLAMILLQKASNVGRIKVEIG